MPRRASTRLIAEAIGLFCGDVNVVQLLYINELRTRSGVWISAADIFPALLKRKAGGASHAARRMKGS